MRIDRSIAFVSYSREDSAFALRLVRDLKRAGLTIWIDQMELEPGVPWDRAIQTALITCTRLLVILSPVAVISENVLDEVSFALSKQKKIIPILYRECDVPYRLDRLQRIDLTTNYTRGVQLLCATFRVKQTVSQVPEPIVERKGERPLQPDKSRGGKDTKPGPKQKRQNSGRQHRLGDAGRIIVNVFDGTRQPYSEEAGLLITLRDGNLQRAKTQIRQFFYNPTVLFAGLPLFNDFGDNYTVLVSAEGYQDTGYFPVEIAANVDRIADLMMLPQSDELNFSKATWKMVGSSRPRLKSLLASGSASDAEAANRYASVMKAERGEVLAALLNITTRMQQIHLPQQTPLDYLKRVVWSRDADRLVRLAKDRLFAWADPELVRQLEQATFQHPPEFVAVPVALRPGATRSYKQTHWGEANLQLTFHENDRCEVDGVNCVMVELEIDYFKDPMNHLLLGGNAAGGGTNPKIIYALSWIAGRRAGTPEFDPLYTIQKSRSSAKAAPMRGAARP